MNGLCGQVGAALRGSPSLDYHHPFGEREVAYVESHCRTIRKVRVQWS